MKDLEKKLDDFCIKADITHETSQIVIAELKNDKKYAESTVIQALKLSKTWFRAFMKNFGYGMRRNVGSSIIVPELKIILILSNFLAKKLDFKPWSLSVIRSVFTM